MSVLRLLLPVIALINGQYTRNKELIQYTKQYNTLFDQKNYLKVDLFRHFYLSGLRTCAFYLKKKQ